MQTNIIWELPQNIFDTSTQCVGGTTRAWQGSNNLVGSDEIKDLTPPPRCCCQFDTKIQIMFFIIATSEKYFVQHVGGVEKNCPLGRLHILIPESEDYSSRGISVPRSTIQSCGWRGIVTPHKIVMHEQTRNLIERGCAAPCEVCMR